MGYINAIKRNNDILVWERNNGKREVVNYRAPYYFYTKSKNGKFTSMYGDKLERHDFPTSKEFNTARASFSGMGHELFESDIPADLKLLSKKYYGEAAPVLNVTFFDIEVDYDKERGFSSIEDPYAPINSIALYNNWQNRMVVIAVPPEDYDGPLDEETILKEMHDIAALPVDCLVEIKLFENEHNMLEYFLEEIQDSDVLSGWNSEYFDIPYLGKRLELMGKRYINQLSFPEGNPPKFREVETKYRLQWVLDLSGRISADYLLIFKKYEVVERPTYRLEAIADEILIDPKTKEPVLPKLEYEGSLANLYRNNFIWFIRYNLRDTEVLKGFEDRLGYIELANQMYHLSTGLFKHVTGTLKLSELATINYCHYELDGVIVNDVHVPDSAEKAKGAFVLLPQVGEHDWIGAIDINSLYPAAIRSNNISPETIIGQFIENERAFEEIKKASLVYLTLELDSGGEQLRATAEEWRTALLDKNWSISGYGTIFSQEKQGIMPSILEYWYSTRKKYQKLMIEAKESGDQMKATYYDKLQYVYKIKLNSYYGSLLNAYFRFYDKRLGESTTGTSRAILLHQCAKVAELLDGEYAQTDRLEYDKHGKPHIGYSDKWSVIYGDSVAADTTIILEDGTDCNIEDLFKEVQETHNNGKEYYFPKNVKTLTYNESINKSTFEDVVYVMRHKTAKKMYRLWVTNSTYVDVTEDHSLIGYKNTQQRVKGESCLIEVKPNELGNNIKSLIFLKNIPRKMTCDQGYSKEIYEFLGMIIGDGSAAKKANGGVSLSIGMQDIPEITKKLIDPLVEQGYITSYKTRNNTHDVRMCGTKIFKLVKLLLYNSGKKGFPAFIFNETIENISSFLRGYFSADGTVSGNVVSLCSVNLDFIKQAQRLLFYCGISSNYFTENTENSYNGVYSGTYSKKLSIKNTEVFEELVGFIQDRKSKKIPKNGKELSYLSMYGFAICRGGIRIEEIEYNDYVYDIEVGNTHMFFANNILVHNTDSTYFNTHAKSKKDAIAIADAVGEQTSASFPEFMRETFLCAQGFNNIIKTGREIVSDKGIFVDKKRYFLHIVDDEGFKCDKIKVMGLDTKKTTLPKEVSKKLNGFVERYLKGESWDTIATEIVDYKDELYNTNNVMFIGLPKGVQNVEKYTRNYNNGEKTFLPGHVAASIFYNICRKNYNDKESLEIKSGMKIKVFYLNRTYGRFKSIAIPVDIEEVPTWFIDNFIIDKEAHIERLVDKPMNNIIKAIGKQTPSKQSLFTDSMLEF